MDFVEIFIYVAILAIIFIIIKKGSKEEKSRKSIETVIDLLNKNNNGEPTYDTMMADKEAVADRLEYQNRDEKPIRDDLMLITRNTFEDMCQSLKDTCCLVSDICREREFQNYIYGIKSGNANIDNSQSMFESLIFFIIQDVLRNYSRLGNRYYSSGGRDRKICNIEYDTSEGQLLFVVVMPLVSR